MRKSLKKINTHFPTNFVIRFRKHQSYRRRNVYYIQSRYNIYWINIADITK